MHSAWFQSFGKGIKFNIHVFNILFNLLLSLLLLLNESLFSLLLSLKGFFVNFWSLLFFFSIGFWSILGILGSINSIKSITPSRVISSEGNSLSLFDGDKTQKSSNCN